jgi:hypothetical protein
MRELTCSYQTSRPFRKVCRDVWQSQALRTQSPTSGTSCRHLPDAARRHAKHWHHLEIAKCPTGLPPTRAIKSIFVELRDAIMEMIYRGAGDGISDCH